MPGKIKQKWKAVAGLPFSFFIRKITSTWSGILNRRLKTGPTMAKKTAHDWTSEGLTLSQNGGSFY
jgi:hypothetical protein